MSEQEEVQDEYATGSSDGNQEFSHSSLPQSSDEHKSAPVHGFHVSPRVDAAIPVDFGDSSKPRAVSDPSNVDTQNSDTSHNAASLEGEGDLAVSLGEIDAENENDYDDYMDPSGNELDSSNPDESNSNLAFARVVETGQEQTGRWTRVEHENFLSALQQYGKEWKKVAAKVKTRTVVQTRTHAQKYFQKLQKAMGNKGDDGDSLLYDLATDTKKTPQKRKSKSTTKSQLRQAQQAQLAEAAANLISHMSSNAAASATPPIMHGFGSPPLQPPPQSFNTPLNAPPAFPDHDNISSQMAQIPYSSFSSDRFVGGPFGNGGRSIATPMKIVAPSHDHAFKLGKFPEPSPAACGKRKLAEIAAAQMLAGVAASGGAAVTAMSMENFCRQTTPPPHGDISSSRGPGPMQLADNFQAEPMVSSKFSSKPPGSLQIVNPDSLGVSFSNLASKGGKRNKLLHGQASPSTPWDGQLEALLSEAKQKGMRPFGIEDEDEDFLNSSSQSPVPSSEGIPDGAPHSICGPSSSSSNLETIRRYFSLDSQDVVTARIEELQRLACTADDKGYTPLHTAAALCMASNVPTYGFQRDNVRLLLSAGANVACPDYSGNSPLHWAARAGDSDIAYLLILKSCPIDAQNNDGETALHWAMRAGTKGHHVVRVLIENGARACIFNRDFKRPLDVAAEPFPDEQPAPSSSKGKKQSKSAEAKKRLLEQTIEKRNARANMLHYSVPSRTLILHHQECLEHIAKSDRDWEVPDRVKSIMGRIEAKLDMNDEAAEHSDITFIQPQEVTVSSEFARASLELLSRVHSAEYLTFVNDLSKELEKRRKLALLSENNEEADGSMGEGSSHSAAVVPFTPMVQRTMKSHSSIIKKGSHSDTSFSAGSLRAARRAAGAVQHAVDRVLLGRDRNAFCVVRPPGHHAGVNGLLAGGESCGFCIFNNVASGALHALSDAAHRPRCERIAIVDIDVHHGNGTEEIVLKSQDPGRLLFFSVHLYDNEKRKGANGYSFYPGTGDEDDVARNIINVPLAPMWKEKDRSASRAAMPLRSQHNTRNKVKQKSSSASSSKPSSPHDTSQDETSDSGRSVLESDSASRKGNSGPPTPNHYMMGFGRQAYRRAIQHRLLPALRAFNPDLIMMSVGFDAAKGDVGNAKHFSMGKEQMGIDLEPEDYAWTTRKILEVADICCQGKVVSVLEGGYGRTPGPPPQASSADTPSAHEVLDKSCFSECAMRHLQALIDPYDAEMRHPTKE